MKKRKIKAAVVMISLSQGLQYTVAPVLNQVQQYYADVPASLVQLLVTAPALASMVMALISGWLVTKISKKRLILAGCFLMGATGLLPALCDRFTLLLLSRLLMGVGMGLLMSLSTAVIAEQFEGAERTSAMGLQGASAGAGVLLASGLAGLVGRTDFHCIYMIHLQAFVSMAGLAFCLPETGVTCLQADEALRINGRVLRLCALTFLEAVLLSAFTTNIALHLAGQASVVTARAGRLTAVFSLTQILAGMMLGAISTRTKELTLPLSVGLCAAGGYLLTRSADRMPLLILGAVLFGLSQGFFIPRAMFEASEMVSAASVALASACLTLSINIGQFISPSVLNALAAALDNQSSTQGVFKIVAMVGMVTAAAAAAIQMIQEKRKEKTHV